MSDLLPDSAPAWLVEHHRQRQLAAELAEAKRAAEAQARAEREAEAARVAAANAASAALAVKWRESGQAEHAALGEALDGRTAGGTWAKGTGGNPAGRPVGIKNPQALLQHALDDAGAYPTIVAQVIGKAKAGDLVAAKMVMDRVHATQRPVALPVAFALDTTQPLDVQAASVVDAVARGELTPADAQTVLQCLTMQASIAQAADLEERLRKLETGRGPTRTGAVVIDMPRKEGQQ